MTAPDPGQSNRLEGLSEAEAARRLRQDGPNALPDRRWMGWLRLLWNIVTEPMFVMLLIATAIYAAIGDAGEAALLLASVAIVMWSAVLPGSAPTHPWHPRRR